MGIVRKKRLTNKKSKYNLSNEKKNGISNRNSKSNSLQNGGSHKGIRPQSAFVKRSSTGNVSRVRKGWNVTKKGVSAAASATWTGTKVGAEGIARSATTLPFGVAAAGVHAGIAGTGQAAYRIGKAGLGTVALGTKALYQKYKLGQADKKIQAATGEKSFSDYQKKESKMIADYQSKIASADGATKFVLMNKLATERSALRNKFDSSKHGFKAPEVGNAFKATDFSEIIKQKRQAHNSAQTQKKSAIATKFGLNTKQTTLTTAQTALANARNKLGDHDASIKTAEETLKSLTKLSPQDLQNMASDPEKKQKYIEEFNAAKKKISDLAYKRVGLSQAFIKTQSESKKAEDAFKKAESSIAKNTKKQKLYTIEELKNKVLRRRAGLNSTLGSMGKLWKNVATKTGATYDQSGRIGRKVTMFGRNDYKKDANFFSLGKSSQKVKTVSTGPSFGSTLSKKLKPMVFKGAEAMLNSVKHINKPLSDLSIDIKALEGKVATGEKDFEAEKNALRAQRKEGTTEWNALIANQKQHETDRIYLSTIKSQFETKKNRLAQVQQELSKRVPEKKIQLVESIIDKKFKANPQKYKDLNGLLDTNKKLNIGSLDGKKLNTLLESAKLEGQRSQNYAKFNLLQTIYKLNKNKIKLGGIDAELASIK